MAVGRLPAGVAIGILTLDQLINGLAKIVLIALAVLLVPLPAWMRNGVLLLLGLTVAALAALLMVAHASERLRAFAAGFSGLAAQLADQAAVWADHLKLLRNPSQAWPVLAIGIAKKGLELAAILAVQVACGIPLSIEIAVLALAALSVTTMLPAAPANLGVYEATVVFVYQSAGVPQPVALAAALLQHAAVLAPSLAVGAIALLVHHRRSSRAAR
jgi:uncharacterized membrane protein YbhN (UPF0104 family)